MNTDGLAEIFSAFCRTGYLQRRMVFATPSATPTPDGVCNPVRNSCAVLRTFFLIPLCSRGIAKSRGLDYKSGNGLSPR